MLNISRTRTARLLATTAIVLTPLGLVDPSFAACTTLGGVTTCDTAGQNPWTTTVGEGNVAAADNRTVNVGAGSQIAVGNANAISLRDGANVTVANTAVVSAQATTTGGNFGTGGNTVEFRNNGNLTVDQGGQVLALGTQGSAEAINFQGTGNTVTNNGLIDANNSVAIWSQNTSGLNTVVNNETGIIEAGNGTTNTVIGGSGSGALDFTNRGAIRGSISLAGGNDILRLYTGSSVTGNFSGGAGNDQIYLSGGGQATLPGNFVGFESLIKNDPGTWTLSGTITGVTVSDVREGTLVLTGDNTNYTGQILVQPAGTLEARAQSLPPTVTNDGLVRFAQPDNGTYAGTIAGGGAIEKTGAGTLTLSGNTNIAGNTRLNEGTLVMASSGVLNTAAVVMGNATTLQLDGTLTGPAGGPATITGQTGKQTVVVNANLTGAINLGDDDDTFILNNGTVTGAVDQGDGNDLAQINGGTLTGNLQQGGGIDNFQMVGGTIGSLNQGDALDDFFMSGGHIIDAFDDGDRAKMTGGRIGRVNMKLDDNIFDMSGGTIDRNLVTGFGNDTIILSDGVIGGNISVSGGTDSVTITGGSVGGNVLMSFGSDTFRWDSGGIVYGSVDLGPDNDTAIFSNLTAANLGASPQFTGGEGTDSLTLSNVSTSGVARFQNWESIAATNDTELTFDGTLTLGDAGTGTGGLSVDSTSTLFGGGTNSAVVSAVAGQLANVTNAGRIDLTNGTGTGDTFRIAGNYTGNGGLLFLDTVLGDDSSASDRLVIDGGSAGGTTGISVQNDGGAGAATTADGIMLVQALNGANTGSGTFALSNAVAAGAYEYYLFKGGVSGGSAENWYLRSTLINGSTTPAPAPTDPGTGVEPEEPEPSAPPPSPAPPPPSPDENVPALPTDTPPVAPPDPAEAEAATPPPATPAIPTTPAPVPGPGVVPPTEGATPVEGDIVPLYRVEVPTYSAAIPALRETQLATLSTFHERRGAQDVLRPGELASAAWARVFGESVEQSWGGTVSPNIDGTIWGAQLGLDILRRESDGGHKDTLGLFYAYASLDADIRGQALGWNNLKTGKIESDTHSVGAYWTHIGPQNWYVDAVAMGSWFDGTARSDRAIGIDLDGSGVTLSLETGYPFALGQNWTLEPQAQIIYQHISLDDTEDAFSTIGFDTDDGWTGRIGARLQGRYEVSGGVLEPYLKANLWHVFETEDSVRFGGDAITTRGETTAVELGAGIVHNFNETLSAYAVADYTFDVDGGNREVIEGNIGLRVKW
ncbi:autotransporter outer membrane beta-barrel domain-containing protein [Phyllobacterium sp. 0TCS1.6C]|nr:autotransporter outer membrane beta-barrel domain-containing protein [Phyllobacterium sp. 0TCS1.6A]MCX8280774.1 autotransporter outer membrane beta-barrel domain-containing protein [Phyllobacterium sp. 0TCS1.6C]MCX8292649.1 autotransporter outer membrane beta-barrel domain-containing protein [Phyllobacterium sp. 0TCS1.6A]